MQRKTNGEYSKKKERHIVKWSQEEDDILREQISIHGTDKSSWTIIASKFKDKTARHCKRRWNSYLNSDFKNGAWSLKEDLLLCEAHRVFGNRWTEIAKVVPGRTDNAVKNRFSTLCKKRAKYEALAKENSSSYIKLNDQTVIMAESLHTNPPGSKMMRRTHIPDALESHKFVERSQAQSGATCDPLLRTPLAVLVQNIHDNYSTSHHESGNKTDVGESALSNEGTFLKKDDPKVVALMQQAELLSSLAIQLNMESTDQRFENARKVIQDFSNQRKEGNMLRYKTSGTDFQQDLKGLLEDVVKTGNKGSWESWRQLNLLEVSPNCSEYSAGSTAPFYTINDKNQQTSLLAEGGSYVPECENRISSGEVTDQEMFHSCGAQVDGDGVFSSSSSTVFGSPLQVTPLFRSLGAGIPSPQFSETERRFLMKTLGMECSPSPAFSTDDSHPPPPCKRALLQSL